MSKIKHKNKKKSKKTFIIFILISVLIIIGGLIIGMYGIGKFFKNYSISIVLLILGIPPFFFVGIDSFKSDNGKKKQPVYGVIGILIGTFFFLGGLVGSTTSIYDVYTYHNHMEMKGEFLITYTYSRQQPHPYITKFKALNIETSESIEFHESISEGKIVEGDICNITYLPSKTVLSIDKKIQKIK